MNRTVCSIVSTALAIASASAPHARPVPVQDRDGSPLDAGDGRAWSLDVEPLAYRPAAAGDFVLISGSEVDLETLNLDEPTFAPLGKLTFRYDDIAFRVRGFGLSTDASVTADAPFTAGTLDVVAGDRIEAEFEFITVDATIGYRFRPVFSDPASSTAITFDVFAGARGHHLDLSYTQNGVNTIGADSTYVLAIIGAAIELDLPAGFAIEVEADAGIGPDADGFSIDAAFSYDVTNSVRAQIGFRHHSLDLEDPGGVSWDGWAAGLYVGVGVTF